MEVSLTFTQRLQLHLQWRNNPAMHQLSQPVIDFLQSGIIYTFGRDHQFRPVIILNAHRIDTKKVDFAHEIALKRIHNPMPFSFLRLRAPAHAYARQGRELDSDRRNK